MGKVLATVATTIAVVVLIHL